MLGERGHDAAGGSQRAGVAAASLTSCRGTQSRARARSSPPQFFFQRPTARRPGVEFYHSCFWWFSSRVSQLAARGGVLLARGQATAYSAPPPPLPLWSHSASPTGSAASVLRFFFTLLHAIAM